MLTDEGLVSFECKVVGYPTPVLRWFKDGQELKPGDVYQLSGTNSLGRSNRGQRQGQIGRRGFVVCAVMPVSEMHTLMCQILKSSNAFEMTFCSSCSFPKMASEK